jgi:hypothetical protein
MTVKNQGSSSSQQTQKYSTIRAITSSNLLMPSLQMKSSNVEKSFLETNKLLNKIKEVYNQRTNQNIHETDYANSGQSGHLSSAMTSSLPMASTLIKTMEQHLKQPMIKLPQSQSYLYNQNQNYSNISLAYNNNNNSNNNNNNINTSNQQTIQLLNKIKEINKSESQTDVVKLNRLLYGSTRTNRSNVPTYSPSSKHKSDHAINQNRINFDDKDLINNLSINNISHLSNSTNKSSKLASSSIQSQYKNKPSIYKMSNGKLEELDASNPNVQVASFQPSVRVKSSTKRPILLESELNKTAGNNQVQRSMSMYYNHDKENKNNSKVKFDIDKSALQTSKSNGYIGNLKLNDSAIKLNSQGEGTITFNFDLPPNVNPNNLNVMLDKKKENIIIESTSKNDNYYVISLPKNATFDELEYSLDRIEANHNSKEPSLNLEVAMNIDLPDDIDPSNDIEVVLNGDQILIIKKETEEVLYRIALPENTDFDRMEYNFQKLSEDAKSNRVKSNDSKFNTNSRCMNHIYDNNVSKFFVYKIEIDFNFSSQMNIYQSFLYLSNF